jgi:hypothetical protein
MVAKAKTKVNLQVQVSSRAHEKLLREIAVATARVPASVVAKPAVLPILIRHLAASLSPSDPLSCARLRGIAAQEELAGETMSASEVAKLLGISRQAVDKRRTEGKLLAVEPPKRGNRYPVWQFGRRGVLDGLETVLAALKEHDAWAQVRFMTSGNHRLGGKTPIERLRAGDLASVVRAAELFDVHGAP